MTTPVSSHTPSGLSSMLSGALSQLGGQSEGAVSSSAASVSSASSTASSSSTSITILQGGHSNSVLSLALNSDGTLLSSGGEDGYLCLWLAAENRLLKRRPIVHAPMPPPSNSRAAGNSRNSRHSAVAAPAEPLSTAISHVLFANRPENENRLFIACGPCLYEVDMMRFQSTDGPFQPQLIAQHEDDVNQVALNDTETLLAACDDNGYIKVIELSASPAATPTLSNSRPSPGVQPSQKARSASPNDEAGCLSNATTPTQNGEPIIVTRPAPRVILSVKKHSNICSSLCFRRCSRKDDETSECRSNGALTELGNGNSAATAAAATSSTNGYKWQLISGGMDCKLQLVEFQRKGRSVNIFDMNEFVEPDSAAFVVNPPFIHSVAITPDGGVVACGLENGNIELFDARRKNLTHLQTLYGHTQAVGKVLFVASTNDSDEQAAHESRVHTNYLISAGNDGNIFCWEVKDAGIGMDAAAADGNAQNSQHDGISIKVINCVEHWHKINWIEAKSIDKVYVGDQSTQIALCSLVP